MVRRRAAETIIKDTAGWRRALGVPERRAGAAPLAAEPSLSGADA
jgi:hypothetical protein